MKLMKQFIKETKWIVLATTLTICLQIAGTLGVPKLVGKLIDVGIVSGDQQVIKTIGIQMFLVHSLEQLPQLFLAICLLQQLLNLVSKLEDCSLKNFNNSR